MAMLVITRGYIIFVQLWPWNEQSLITSHLPMVEISQNYCPFLGYPISIDIQWMPCSKNVHPSRVCDFFLGGLLSQKKSWKGLVFAGNDAGKHPFKPSLNYHSGSFLGFTILYTPSATRGKTYNHGPQSWPKWTLWLSLPYAPWCCYIYPHHWLIFGVNVGRYSSDMEDLSMFIDIPLQLVTPPTFHG